MFSIGFQFCQTGDCAMVRDAAERFLSKAFSFVLIDHPYAPNHASVEHYL